MTFTKLSTLAIFALSGAAVVGLGQWAAARLGENALIPPITWGATLLLLGGIVLSLPPRGVRSCVVVGRVCPSWRSSLNGRRPCGGAVVRLPTRGHR